MQVTGSPAEPAGARLSGPDEAISSEDAGDGDEDGSGGGGQRYGSGQRGDGAAKGAGARASRQRKRKEPVILDEREQRAQKRMVRPPLATCVSHLLVKGSLESVKRLRVRCCSAQLSLTCDSLPYRCLRSAAVQQ